MKTAISMPDPLFKSAEKLSHQLGMSRSQLYVTAIKEFLLAHKKNHTTDKLNEVYSREESSLDPVLKDLQARTLSRDVW